MLIRLLALEAGLVGGVEAPNIQRIRRTFEASDGLGRNLRQRLADTSGGSEAIEIVREYSDRLVVHRSSGSQTTLDEIKKAIVEMREVTGVAPFVCIDYLQKIPFQGAPNEDERITHVVEGVKDMALDYDVPVLCVVASDKEGITAGIRMRINHLRGSSALAYEADTILMLNNKYDVVARHHLVYDAGNIERFKHWAVFTIEKSRSGVTGVDLEFPKRFDQSRFETKGQLVREKLMDERVFVE
jgi:replicative DNA helicase